MANRFRNERIEIKLTKEEKEIFEKKMKLANCKTMSHFLRKCVLEKEIYIVDLEPFRDILWLLSNATNNINQIAKATNIIGVIYKKNIDYMIKLQHGVLYRQGTIADGADYCDYFILGDKEKLSDFQDKKF